MYGLWPVYPANTLLLWQFMSIRPVVPVVYRLAGLACCATCAVARKCRRSRFVQAPSARMYHTNYKLIKSFAAFGRLRVVFMSVGPRTWNHNDDERLWSSADANRAIYVVVKQREAAWGRFEGVGRWRLHADYRDRQASVFYGGNVLRSHTPPPPRLSIDLMSGCSGFPCPRRIYWDKLWLTVGIAMKILPFVRSSFTVPAGRLCKLQLAISISIQLPLASEIKRGWHSEHEHGNQRFVWYA